MTHVYLQTHVQGRIVGTQTLEMEAGRKADGVKLAGALEFDPYNPGTDSAAIFA